MSKELQIRDDLTTYCHSKNDSIALSEEMQKPIYTLEGKFKISLGPKLLKDRKADTGPGWAFVTPPCFNEALNIGLTERREKGVRYLVWTQGTRFHFTAGDVVYDSSGAYRDGGEYFENVKICIRVKEGFAARPAVGFMGRDPGFVTFDTLSPTPDFKSLVKNGEHALTQDDFVRLIIGGSLKGEKASRP